MRAERFVAVGHGRSLAHPRSDPPSGETVVAAMVGVVREVGPVRLTRRGAP
jgi:hypothetical protein